MAYDSQIHPEAIESAHDAQSVFSTRSAPSLSGEYVVGADWPQWQRELYPFTYMTDAEAVRRGIADQDRMLAKERAALGWYVRKAITDPRAVPNPARMVNRIRANIDQLQRYRRNGETQLRLIEAARS